MKIKMQIPAIRDFLSWAEILRLGRWRNFKESSLKLNCRPWGSLIRIYKRRPSSRQGKRWENAFVESLRKIRLFQRGVSTKLNRNFLIIELTVGGLPHGLHSRRAFGQATLDPARQFGSSQLSHTLLSNLTIRWKIENHLQLKRYEFLLLLPSCQPRPDSSDISQMMFGLLEDKSVAQSSKIWNLAVNSVRQKKPVKKPLGLQKQEFPVKQVHRVCLKSATGYKL